MCHAEWVPKYSVHKILSLAFLVCLYAPYSGIAAPLLTASVPEGSQLSLKEFFALSYNNEHEQPDWVAWQISPQSYGPWRRDNDFRRDPDIVDGSSYETQFRNSGFDRGHLAPASEFSFGQSAMSQTFLMSNISPQNPDFNRHGLWRKLELFIKERIELDQEYFIIAGPILSSALPKLPDSVGGDSRVSIAEKFFKAIICLRCRRPRGIAFVFPNSGSAKDIFSDDFVFSIDELERKLGIDLFYQLDDKLENSIERQIDLSMWRLQ